MHVSVLGVTHDSLHVRAVTLTLSNLIQRQAISNVGLEISPQLLELFQKILTKKLKPKYEIKKFVKQREARIRRLNPGFYREYVSTVPVVERNYLLQSSVDGIAFWYAVTKYVLNRGLDVIPLDRESFLVRVHKYRREAELAFQKKSSSQVKAALFRDVLFAQPIREKLFSDLNMRQPSQLLVVGANHAHTLVYRLRKQGMSVSLMPESLRPLGISVRAHTFYNKQKKAGRERRRRNRILQLKK